MHIFIAMNPVTRYWWRTETKNCCPAREITSHFEQLQIYIYIYISYQLSVLGNSIVYLIEPLHIGCTWHVACSPLTHHPTTNGTPQAKSQKKQDETHEPECSHVC